MKKTAVLIAMLLLSFCITTQAHAFNGLWFNSSAASTIGRGESSEGLYQYNMNPGPGDWSPCLNIGLYEPPFDEEYYPGAFKFEWFPSLEIGEPENPWEPTPFSASGTYYILISRYGESSPNVSGSVTDLQGEGYCYEISGLGHYIWDSLAFNFVQYEEGDPNRWIVGGYNTEPVYPVPEPATLSLLGIGLLPMLRRKR